MFAGGEFKVIQSCAWSVTVGFIKSVAHLTKVKV